MVFSYGTTRVLIQGYSLISISEQLRHRAKECYRISRTVVSKVLVTVLIFVVIHSAFWGVEHLYHRWCVSDFWISMFATHSKPCEILRDLSTLARSANASLLALIIGAASNVFTLGTGRASGAAVQEE